MLVLNLSQNSALVHFEQMKVEESSERPILLINHAVVNFPIISFDRLDSTRIVSPVPTNRLKNAKKDRVTDLILGHFFREIEGTAEKRVLILQFFPPDFGLDGG